MDTLTTDKIKSDIKETLTSGLLKKGYTVVCLGSHLKITNAIETVSVIIDLNPNFDINRDK